MPLARSTPAAGDYHAGLPRCDTDADAFTLEPPLRPRTLVPSGFLGEAQSPEAYAVGVGQLFYKGAEGPIEIEDRTLAHLRLVFMTKLRRGEPFLFETESPHGKWPRDYWIHPTLPLQFRFVGSRVPQINQRWIDALMQSANSTTGLRIVREPPE